MPLVTDSPEDAQKPGEPPTASSLVEPDLAAGRRRLPRWAVPLLALTAVPATAGAATLALNPGDTVAEPSGSSKTYACTVMLAANEVDKVKDYCDRYVRDLSRRVELTQAQRDALAADQKRAEQALDRPGRCVWPARSHTVDCARWRLVDRAGSDDPGPADVEAVREALREGGFTDAVVRLARPDDPAMPGSIFFSIPLGDACLLGYMTSLRGGGSRTLAGRLPNGHC
jgi:hypothetical protein